MATAPQQGIMALPAEQAPTAPQMSLQESYGAMRSGLQEARPDADMELQEALAEIKAEIQDVTDEQLDDLIAAIQSLYDNPETYAQEVAQLVADGEIEAGDLPEEYDEEFLAATLMVLIDEQRSRQSAGMPPEMTAMMPPQQFARGGIAEAARMVASQGRRGDTMLAHITPREARMLKAGGGSGTINPRTGLPEFFLKGVFKAIGKTFKRVGGAIKSALKSPIGRIIATVALGAVLGPAVAAFAPGLSGAAAAAVTGGLSSGIVSAAAGDKPGDILKSAALGAFSAPGGPVSNFVGKYTGQYLANPVVREAANAAIIGTAGGALSGQGLKESLKTGLTSGVIAGGVTIASGGTTAQANNQAATQAADAVDNLSTQNAIDDFYGVNKDIRGAATQRASESTNFSSGVRPNGDGTFTQTQYDRIGRPIFTQQVTADGSVISTSAVNPPASTAVNKGLGSYMEVEPPNTIFAQRSSSAPTEFGLQARPNLEAQTVLDAQAASRGAVPTNQPLATAGPYMDVEGFQGVGGPTGPTALQKPPGILESGKQILKGDVTEGLGNLFAPSSPTTADIVNSTQYRELVASGLSPDKALTQLSQEYSPGFFRSYGPTVAAGIGALGLAGGFSPEQPDDGRMNEMRQPIDLSGDPSRYYVQGLPGVQYGSRGEITGTSPTFTPYGSMANVRVPGTSYINYQPRFMNMGGIAALAQGGYPRRTGQIDGPGTETSDSIPAMLSDGEFVMTARAVRGMGNGNRRDGARKMYALMHQLEKNAARG